MSLGEKSVLHGNAEVSHIQDDSIPPAPCVSEGTGYLRACAQVLTAPLPRSAGLWTSQCCRNLPNASVFAPQRSE